MRQPTTPRLLPSRRALLAGATACATSLAFLSSQRARAALRLDVTQGNVQPLPIALPDFVGGTPGDADGARGVTQVITANLQALRPVRADRSGRLHREASPPSIRFRASRTGASSMPRRWSPAASRARATDGCKAEFRLWDVFAGQQLIGQQYFTTPDNWRRIAHIISDAIYERLTGEKGYFDTRIVFVDETGPKERRVKRLAIMDQDGANVRYLTRGDDLVLTPRFSPSTAGDHLHVLRAGRPARLSCSTSRPDSARSSAISPA